MSKPTVVSGEASETDSENETIDNEQVQILYLCRVYSTYGIFSHKFL